MIPFFKKTSALETKDSGKLVADITSDKRSAAKMNSYKDEREFSSCDVMAKQKTQLLAWMLMAIP